MSYVKHPWFCWGFFNCSFSLSTIHHIQAFLEDSGTSCCWELNTCDLGIRPFLLSICLHALGGRRRQQFELFACAVRTKLLSHDFLRNPRKGRTSPYPCRPSAQQQNLCPYRGAMIRQNNGDKTSLTAAGLFICRQMQRGCLQPRGRQPLGEVAQWEWPWWVTARVRPASHPLRMLQARA